MTHDEPPRLKGRWQRADFGGYVVDVCQGERVIKTAVAADGQLGATVDMIDRTVRGVAAEAEPAAPSSGSDRVRALEDALHRIIMAEAALAQRLRGRGGPELHDAIDDARPLLRLPRAPAADPAAAGVPSSQFPVPGAAVDSLGALQAAS